MKRKAERENAFLAEFELCFGHSSLTEVLETSQEDGEYELDAFSVQLLRLYDDHSFEVDKVIGDNLKGWSSERLPKAALGLLRLAVAEMLFGEPDMDSIVINEAVELAKKYGGDNDYQFVNGLLGTVSRQKGAVLAAEPAEKDTAEAVAAPEKEAISDAKEDETVPADSPAAGKTDAAQTDSAQEPKTPAAVEPAPAASGEEPSSDTAAAPGEEQV